MHPVLVDVGASGAAPQIWQPIAKYSVYVGFDPDQRDLGDTSGGAFRRSIIVNKAITERDGTKEMRFYYARHPHCSSSLKPDQNSLSDFLFSDLFTVEREGSVPAETLTSVLRQFGLDHIDWLKIDTQGTDLRIWRSLREDIRSRLLAADVEPGLVDAYEDEDLFADTHRELTRNGFWLSNLNVRGSIRIRKQSHQEAARTNSKLTKDFLEHVAKKTPTWCEARYLRGIDSLDVNVTPRDFGLLWVFSILDNQAGFALDLAIEYEKRFGRDDISNLMKNQSITSLGRIRAEAIIPMAKSFLPVSFKRWLKRAVQR